MSFKVTGLLAALLAVLVAFVVFYEQPQMREETRAANAKKKFIDLSRQSVARLTLVNKFGRFVAEKKGTEWTIADPVKTVGDWEMLEGMVSAAKDVERGRVVVDSAAYVGGKVDLTQFGLDPPVVEVRFQPKSGDEIWLRFGDENPAKKAVYLTWSGGNKVVLAKRDQRDFFQRKLFDLRDKHMLPVDQDRVYRLVMTTPKGVIETYRDGLAWNLVKPIRDRGDASAVNSLIAKLRTEPIVAFASETCDDPAAYGFDNPTYRVTLYDQDSTVVETLLLGKSIPDSRLRYLYGRILSRPQVFEVEPYISDFLNVTPGHLRYKQVFEFDRTGIDRLQLAYRDSTVECRKGASDAWTVVNPTGKKVDAKAVSNLIDRIYNLRAQDFSGSTADKFDAYGLAHPDLVVSLFRGDALVRTVTIAKHSDQWYGTANGMQDVVELTSQVMAWLHLNLLPQNASEGTKTGA